jgi:prophage tail gpP-like protein
MIPPIKLYFKSAQGGDNIEIDTFTSYHFDRNILIPASAFRFTAPGVDKEKRLSIRSGDYVFIYGADKTGEKQIGTGWIDETDTHITPSRIEYVLTGRDTLGAFVDNDAVDSDNKIINSAHLSLENILKILLKNTRIPQGFKTQQLPNGLFLLQTNPGETKANIMQRYLEFTNCLMWTDSSGQVTIGKPNFAQETSGKLILNKFGKNNNCLEGRVRRNLNQVIRRIVTQLQSTEQVDPTPRTLNNNIEEMKLFPGVGRSVFRLFSYGSGNDVVNNLSGVAVGGNPWAIGKQLSQREIAKDNMKVLDVEIVLQGHINSRGNLYNIDQIYDVLIEDENLYEPMYVYACSYELTLEHGMMTRLRLCKINTIVATAAQT